MKKDFSGSNRVRNSAIQRTPLYLDRDSERELRKRIDQFIDTKIEHWYAKVPGAHLLEEKEINKEYYKRHLIETAWRIRLLRVVESKAIAEIAKVNALSAQAWARYEMAYYYPQLF